MEYRKKIIHLFPAHPIFSKSFLPFLCEKFPNYDWRVSLFILSGQQAPEYKHERLSIVNAPNDMIVAEEIGRALIEYDIVIMHSMFCLPNARLRLLFKYRDLLRKIVWIEWGYDYYLLPKSGLLGKVKYAYKKITLLAVARRIENFVGIHPIDVEQYDSIIAGDANKYCVRYRTTSGVKSSLQNYTHINISEKLKAGLPVHIFVNHRADKDLNHIDVLNQLSKFKNENIRLTIPLSYGNKKYAQLVKNYAQSIFGDKVQCLLDIMERDAYTQLLRDIDIFILNSNRQIALGNVHQMLLMQKKIYMPSTSVLYEYFVRNNISIQPLETLKDSSFEELTSNIDMTHGRNVIIEYYSKDIIEEWSELFDNILRHSYD